MTATNAEGEFIRVSPWIQAALQEGGNTHSLADIDRAIKEDRMVLRTFPRCAFLLSVAEYPQFKALNVWGCGGEDNAALSEVRDFVFGQLPAMTKAAGFRRFEAKGRPGWFRALKGLGATRHPFLFKEV